MPLRIANDTRYGPGVGIRTRDTGMAEHRVCRFQTGPDAVNGRAKNDPRLPFGAIKASGYGHELSSLGIGKFVNAKSVWIRWPITGGYQPPGVSLYLIGILVWGVPVMQVS
ncbi:MAG: aldehyde dehydrogenase family protein [Acidiferrobacterales bacterium]